jgi:hypothetical protein
MPEFVMLIAGDETRFDRSEEEVAAAGRRVMAWFEEHTAAGRIVEGAGRRLQPSGTAVTIHLDGAQPLVTDGPFAETKEQIGGFAVVNAADMDAAVALIKTWPGLPGSRIELRPVFVME